MSEGAIAEHGSHELISTGGLYGVFNLQAAGYIDPNRTS